MKAKEVRAAINSIYEEMDKIKTGFDQARRSLELQIATIQKQCRHKRELVDSFFRKYECKYCGMEMKPPKREGVER